MRTLLSIGEAAAKLGVCVGTLRGWERSGKLLPRLRTVGGHRRYDEDDLPGRKKTDCICDLTVAYARVSSHDQRADLTRQCDRLRHECAERGYANVEVISDLGSGLNFAKRGLRRLLGLICRRQIGRLVVMHKDRLLRFGSDLVFEMCGCFGIDVVVVSPSSGDAASTLAADVMELMAVFSARLHGARSHKNRLAAARAAA